MAHILWLLFSVYSSQVACRQDKSIRHVHLYVHREAEEYFRKSGEYLDMYVIPAGGKNWATREDEGKFQNY
jgi:hypothetical protein